MMAAASTAAAQTASANGILRTLSLAIIRPVPPGNGSRSFKEQAGYRRPAKTSPRLRRKLPRSCARTIPPYRELTCIVASELSETQICDRVFAWTAGGDTIQTSYGTNCVGVLGADAVLVLHLGDLELELWHPGWAHTPGDTFLFLPDQRVAVCGDLVFEGYHYNYEDASVRGVRQGLRALEALDADVFVPGHGAAGGPDLLSHQAAYHDAVERIVAAGVEAGRDDALIAADIHAQFPDYGLGVVVPSAVAKFKAHRANAQSK